MRGGFSRREPVTIHVNTQRLTCLACTREKLFDPAAGVENHPEYLPGNPGFPVGRNDRHLDRGGSQDVAKPACPGACVDANCLTCSNGR